MSFTEYELRRSVQADEITADNIEEIAEAYDGKVENGLLSFTVGTHKWYGLVGDTLIVFDSGDVLVFSDSLFERLFSPVKVG